MVLSKRSRMVSLTQQADKLTLRKDSVIRCVSEFFFWYESVFLYFRNLENHLGAIWYFIYDDNDELGKV